MSAPDPEGATASQPSRRATAGRAVGFARRHPVGLLQAVLVSLLLVVILQNVEPTRIDLLFWSLPGVPKLVLILGSMLCGAAVWELVRRLLRRRGRR